ncbi:MAG: DHHW family protein [Lachnospiraceae bacterium]
MKKKKKSLLFFRDMAIVFVLIIFILTILNLIKKDQSFSESENRMLAEKPKFSIERLIQGKYTDRFETYINDQFIFRDLFVKIKTTTDYLLGKRENNHVFLGRKGYLIEDFTEPNQENTKANAEAISSFAKEYGGIKQYMLLSPTAISVLEDYLPLFAKGNDQRKAITEFQTLLEETPIIMIDVEEDLIANKEKGVFYKTDHHWTTFGAYMAFEKAAKIMDLPAENIFYESNIVTYDFQGTLSAKSGFRTGEKEKMEVYLPKSGGVSYVVNYVEEQEKTTTLYDITKLEVRDKYAMFLGGNHSQIKIRTTAESGERLLIFKDSYANSFVQFLLPYYREIVIVDPRYYYEDIRELIKEEKISQILYLYNANTFFEDNTLRTVIAS